MDEIQKVLVESGRKDLAQKYYKKITAGRLKERDEPVYVLFKKAVKDNRYFLKLLKAFFNRFQPKTQKKLSNLATLKKMHSIYNSDKYLSRDLEWNDIEPLKSLFKKINKKKVISEIMKKFTF